jgi:hypothetical protein
MIDYYLKFTDKEQADSVLYTKVPTAWSESVSMDEPPVATEWMDKPPVATEWMDKPNYDNIDVIGAIYKPTGELDAEGNPVMADIGGYHVNIRNYTEAPELEQYAVVPTIPQRVWG